MNKIKALVLGIALILVLCLAVYWVFPELRQNLIAYVLNQAVEDEASPEMTPEEAAVFTTDDAISFGEEIGYGSEYRYESATRQTARISIDDVSTEYHVGEALIEGALYLAAIYPSGILLDNKGAFLWLAKGEQFAPESMPAHLGGWRDTAGSPQLIDKRSDARVLALAQQYMHRVFADPFSLKALAEVEMNAEHVREATAFTVYPAEDKQGFTTFGLQAGDKVTGINGVPLTGLQGLVAAYNGLPEQKRLVVTLQRKQKETVIVLPLFDDS